jgi:DNA-binding NarL/FixJ family response regulator
MTTERASRPRRQLEREFRSRVTRLRGRLGCGGLTQAGATAPLYVRRIDGLLSVQPTFVELLRPGRLAVDAEPSPVSSTYTFVIADDHPLFRGALREAVSGLFADASIAEAGSFDDAVALLDRASDVDLVLLDLTMPGVRGFSGLMYLRAQYPSVPVVVVSANDEPAVIRRCMEFGASGFIPKTLGVEEMRAAIARVLEGDVWTPPDVDLKAGTDAETADLMGRLSTLTPQQVRVLMMLSEGLLNKQIAYNLTVSEATVKAHVSAILQKLNVESRTQAVIAAAKIESGQWPQR